MIMRSFVLFIALCITLASAQTCVPISKNAAAGAATSFKLQNTLGFNIVPVYYSTASSNVELAVQACSDDAAAVNGLKFDFATVGSSIVLTTSTTYTPTTTTNSAPAAATTTTAAPGTRTTAAPSVTTDQPSHTVVNSAQRTAPFSTLLAIVAGLMLIFRPQSQSSIFVVLVMICALYYVQAASTITITVRIGLPDSISSVCAGESCSARSSGGVTDFVTVFGDRFSSLTACSDFTAMPDGWRVADSSYTNALVAIAFKNWGVDSVVVANGSAFNVGTFNSVKVSASVLTTKNDPTYGTMYKVDSCTYKILIQSFKAQDSNPIVSNAGAISNFVSFMGYDYATLDNNVYTTADGSVSGQSGAILIASSSVWQVAPFDDNTLVALSSPGSTINNAFGAACLVTSSGAAYKSISFDSCGSSQLVSATYTAGNIYATVGANQRVLLRRVSAKGTGNTWPTSVSVFNSMISGSYQYATIDNKDPQLIDQFQCQARYYTVPSGWIIPTAIADFAGAVLGKGQWTNTTCFVGSGVSMDQSGNPCADLQTKNISGTIFYGANKCARVILQRSNNKLTSFTMGMKVLFIHENVATSFSDAGEVNLFVTMMQALGIPYDDMYLSDATNDLVYDSSLPLLDTAGNPKYYAIVMSTLTPKYVVGGGSAEALSPDQKNQLLQYCFQYGVRRVMLNGYPADAGFTVTGTYNGTGSYIKFDAQYLSTNAALFSGIKTTASFAFGNYYSLMAKDTRMTPVFHVTPDATTAASDSNIAAGIVKETNGVESLQFYFGNPGQFLDHGPVLANYWIDWVTRGVWMGQRRVYFSPQIDDYFLGTAQYGFADDGNHEVKCNNTDIDNHVTFINALSADTTKVPAGSRVTLTMALNCAEGTLAETTSKLITAARKWQEYFFWESHTWSHMDMTKNPEDACEASLVVTTPSGNPALNCHNSTYDECSAELSKNNDFIKTIWPKNGTDSHTWSKNSMITPAITGLFNPAALKAMYDNNMTCVVGDNSRADLQTDNFYLGFFTTVQTNGFDGIFIIPRYATNIYFNTATPEVNVKQYNDRYGPQGFASVFPTNHTLDMILDAEGSANFRHMAFFRHDPFMFHQCNLHHFWYSYKGTGPVKSWSLVELWLQTVIDKYSTFLNFPLIGVKQQDLRDVYFARREREFCGLSGTINVVNNAGVATWDKITMQSTGSCRPAITGISSCGSTGDCTTETYATDNTIWTSMVGGVSKQITVNKAW